MLVSTARRVLGLPGGLYGLASLCTQAQGLAPGGLLGTCSKRATPGPLREAPGMLGLDRIRIDRTHIAGPIDPVIPVYINKVEQIHAVGGIADGDSDQSRSALMSRI